MMINPSAAQPIVSDGSIVFDEPIVYVLRAIDASPTRSLDMLDFMERSGFPIEQAFVNRFFHSLKRGGKVYISQDLLKYFGYSSLDESANKRNFRDVAVSNGFKKDQHFWIYGNSAYASIYADMSKNRVIDEKSGEILSDDDRRKKSDIDEKSDEILSAVNSRKKSDTISLHALGFPDPNEFLGVNGKGPTKHFIMSSECVKDMMMIIGGKSAEVRRYYRTLEYFCEVYKDYQTEITRQQNERLALLNSDLTARLNQLSIDSKFLVEEAQKNSKIMAEKNDKIDNLNKTMAENNNKIDKLNKTVAKNNDKIENLTDSLHRSNYERAPQLGDGQDEQFALFRVEEKNRDDVHYYVIKGIPASIDAGARRISKNYRTVEKVFDIAYQPNSRNFFKYIRNRLLADGTFTRCSRNEIWIHRDVDMEVLRLRIVALNDERMSVESDSDSD